MLMKLCNRKAFTFPSSTCIPITMLYLSFIHLVCVSTLSTLDIFINNSLSDPRKA